MTITPKERLAILQDVSKAWLELVYALRGLTDAQITAPNTVGEWSVKDLVAHITFWERQAIDRIEAVEHGEAPQRFESVEEINREQAAEAAEYDLEDIREEFEATHDELMHLMEVSPALRRDLVKGMTYGHYREHIPDIKQAAR